MLRTWEVKDGSVVAEGIWEGGSSVGALAIAIFPSQGDAFAEGEPTSGDPEPWPPRFVSSLTVALALSSGKTQLLSLPSLKPLPAEGQPPLPSSAPSPLDALAVDSSATRLSVGSRTGIVTTYALTRSSTAIVASWRRNEAGITSLAYGSDSSLAVAGSDGLPYRATIAEDGEISIDEEWAGFDTDSANGVVLAEGRSFAAGSDGAVRVY